MRIGATPLLSPNDALAVLVAFNREAYDSHRDEVRVGGVIIYNSEEFQLEAGGHSLGMPFSALAKSTGNALADNMIVISAFAQLVGMPQEYLERFVTARFSRGWPGRGSKIYLGVSLRPPSKGLRPSENPFFNSLKPSYTLASAGRLH